MKRLTLSFAVLVAAAGVAPSVAGARVSPAPAVFKPGPRPALVRPAPVKPALVRSALVRPALVTPGTASEWCPDGFWPSPPAQEVTAPPKSASTKPKPVPRPATDSRGRNGWSSGRWYME